MPHWQIVMTLRGKWKNLDWVAHTLRGNFSQCIAANKKLLRAYSACQCKLVNCCASTHSVLRFHFAYNNACRILNISFRNVNVRPHQVTYSVTAFDTLVRNNLYGFCSTMPPLQRFHPFILTVCFFLRIFIPLPLTNVWVWRCPNVIDVVGVPLQYWISVQTNT